MQQVVRVRFAPSPTGGLHIGGVRTVLYNYLFTKKHNGKFILRIEDTDQSRYVAGAEEYIYETLSWCGLEPDESPKHGGNYGPYRQSERKELYRKYAEQLISAGQAYYAFDTPEDLEKMKLRVKTDENTNPQYDHSVRMEMKNSLSLPASEVDQLLSASTPYVIRIKMPENENITLHDMIRGEVHFHSHITDDKVLLKADGMPTYHLAVVVDDYLMKITHAFRGEEWLPSAPVHILLWRYLFGEDAMPEWAHFPLILGPSGKLSKRDGAKYGFPVFAMSWNDKSKGETTEGFRERGFLPEALINLLALLGWNDGTEKEIFTLEELIDSFSIEKVHKGGAKFDFDKAKWFNHEWIKKLSADDLAKKVKTVISDKGVAVKDEKQLYKIISLVKDRCTVLPDFWEQSFFFFREPDQYDTESIKAKWGEDKKRFFENFIKELEAIPEWGSAFIESAFKNLAAVCNIKPGELQLPFRIMLVGGKFGPPVFDIADVLGKKQTIDRITQALLKFDQ
ncbi:MAG: glutamate--tRNA ligase [Bacteroidota bacterium]|nr:glutamate--tRNA ligase [Bacteroidota bacterium]